MDSSIPVFSVLGLQENPIVSSFLHGCQELNSGLHACLASTLSTTHQTPSFVLWIFIPSTSITSSKMVFVYLGFFGDRVSLCSPGSPRTHVIDQAGLEQEICLFLLSEC